MFFMLCPLWVIYPTEIRPVVTQIKNKLQKLTKIKKELKDLTGMPSSLKLFLIMIKL
jgi:hypothetical protein